MSRPIVSDSQQSFAGGLNTVSSEFNIAPTQFRLAENVSLTRYGDLTRRLGLVDWSGSIIGGFPIQGGFCWRRATDHEHLTASQGNLYSRGAFATPCVTTTFKGTLGSSTVKPWFAPFRDGTGEVLYIADGTRLMKYTAAGVLSAVASTPALAVVTVYNQRLYGVTGADQDVHYSAINNGDSCGVTGADSGKAVIRTFSNQKVTGLLTLHNALAIFHVSGVSRWSGLTQDDISIATGAEGISTNTGTIAPRSVIAVEGRGYFLSENGAYHITESGVEALDRPTSPDPLVGVLALLAEDDFADISVVHDKLGRTIRWFIPGVGAYCYSYRLDAWVGPHTGAYTGENTQTGETTLLYEGVDQDGRAIMIQGDASGYLRIIDYPGVYLDTAVSEDLGGQPYPMVVQCRRFFTSDPESEKAWRFAWLFADTKGSTQAALAWSSSTGSGSYTLPIAGGSGIWGTFTWGAFSWAQSASVKPFRIPLSERGNYLDLTYSDGGATGATLSRIDVEGYNYGRRG